MERWRTISIGSMLVRACAAAVVCISTGGCNGAPGPGVERFAYVTADASATPPPQPPEAPSNADTVGLLELRFVLAQSPSADAPRTIRVVPAWGGANRGAARALGWTSVPLISVAGSGVILNAGGVAQTVARGPLPEGRWDRVFIAVESVEGLTSDNFVESVVDTSETDPAEAEAKSDGVLDPSRSVPLESHIEPIAFGFDSITDSATIVELELVILERPSRPGYWRIFVKDARRAASELRPED